MIISMCWYPTLKNYVSVCQCRFTLVAICIHLSIWVNMIAQWGLYYCFLSCQKFCMHFHNNLGTQQMNSRVDLAAIKAKMDAQILFFSMFKSVCWDIQSSFITFIIIIGCALAAVNIISQQEGHLNSGPLWMYY